jgi:hypothetical protein
MDGRTDVQTAMMRRVVRFATALRTRLLPLLLLLLLLLTAIE